MKYLTATMILAGFISTLQATENKVIKNKEAIYSSLLSKFECVFGPNVNDPKWICNKNAPNGWGKYYGNKLKIEKSNRKQLVNNKALVK